MLRTADADRIWHGETRLIHTDENTMRDDPTAARHRIRPGDVLVWVTTDRQIRTTVSPIGGYDPAPNLTVATVLNAVQISGTAIPTVRGLDLPFPVLLLSQQREFAHYARAAQQIMTAANQVTDAAAALRQALADAAALPPATMARTTTAKPASTREQRSSVFPSSSA